MTRHDASAVSADRLLFLSFLLALVWAPLPLGSNQLWAWSFLEVWIFVMAIVWLGLFAAGRVELTPAFRHAWPALALFAAVFLLVSLQLLPLPPAVLALLSPQAAEVHALTGTTGTLSLDPAATRVAVLKTLAFGLLFALTLVLVNRRDRLQKLALALVFSGLFQAAYGSLMMLSGLNYGFFVAKAFHEHAVTGTFSNPNHVSGYLEMCLAIGVGLMLAEMSTKSAGSWRESARRFLNTLLGDKARVRVALVIMVIGLVLAKSRMGNIAFFSSLLVAGGFYLFVARRITTGIVVFFVSVLLVDILVIGNFFGIEKVAEEIQQTTVAGNARVDVNQDVMQIVRDYPLTGTGAGSFASTYPMYTSQEVGFAYYRHAHNDYLQFAAEFGLPGLAMLGGIVLLSLWMAISAQLRRKDQMMRGLGCGVLMAIVALMIHSAVDFNLQMPANGATFVVILAMAWLTRWLGHRAPQRSRTRVPLHDPDEAGDIVELAGERRLART